MAWYKDKTTGEVHRTGDVLLPGGNPTRMNQRIAANPDRYKEMSDSEVSAHIKKVNKELERQGLPLLSDEGIVEAPEGQDTSGS